MPIHDWTRVQSGLFHDLHRDWTIEICRTLNRGLLPSGYFALLERRVNWPEVIAFQAHGPGGLAVAETRPRAMQVGRAESDAAAYARKADRIAVWDDSERVVAIIEIVSPGNKDSRNAFRAFREKIVAFLQAGIHVVIVDLFPPTPRDPEGVHHAIWDDFVGVPFAARPADKPLTVVGYDAGCDLTAYVDCVAVGDDLPDAPLFFARGRYVNIPLETTYRASWAEIPAYVRNQVDPPPSA